MAKKKTRTIVFREEKSYPYVDIEKQAEKENKTIDKYGNVIIGEHFLVLRSEENDLITSFVLDGATANQYIYKCIYTDIIF